ncbi:MAG: FAD-dependent oxidoreductase [Bryobacteraceae bacterium]|nr:FAD-dependent oxidoreductase [Bryobacteraceae bacterium]
MTRRRDLLIGAGAAVLAGCATRRSTIARRAVYDHDFRPVRVAPERIIRTVTGLRPYRPEGFVVRRETLGDKVLVHNYGHGGGGVTLSWGTSHLAVDLANPQAGTAVAVLGAGAVGLATARLLQRRGATVTIYTRALPPETTSNIAGAQWWPTSVFRDDSATAAFREQFVQAARLAHKEFQTLPADRYGIGWLRNYIVSDQPLQDQFILGPTSPLRDLYPEYADLPPNATPFGKHARRFTTMLIQPPIYLATLLQDVQIAGGAVRLREFAAASELGSLPEPVIINCTGLGSGSLFGDQSLQPVKGQLTVLLPQPEVNYNLLSGGLYMFPRRDGILLGGTWERGKWDLAPDREAEAAIVARHSELFRTIAA